MSHRRPDPRQAGLEIVLRSALRLAGDSVEPSADGLERIRAKISARQPPPQPAWMSAAPVVALLALLRRLDPALIWLRYALGIVADRFKPDPDRAGRLGWLRPAAALATGLFVVASASWTITALPQIIANTTNGRHFQPGGTTNVSAGPIPSGTHTRSSVGATIGPTVPGSPSPSPSCTSSSPAHSKSPSPSPSGSASPSPSTSPSPSSSPSPSPSGTTSTGTPSPTDSPSTGAPTNGPAQPLHASQTRPASRHAIASPAPPASKHPSAASC
jgi:hypothetical protein